MALNLDDPFGIEQELDEEAVPPFLQALEQDLEEEERVTNSAALSRPSDHHTRTTAVMAAIGEADTSDVGDIDELVTDIYNRYENLEREVRSGNEADTRMRAAYAEQQAELEGVMNVVQNTNIREVDPSLRDNALAAFNATLSERAEDRAGHALERAYNDSLIDLSLTDPNMAYMLAANDDMGSALDVMADRQTRRMILHREIERAGVVLEDRPWIFWGIDLVHRMVPFIESTAQTGNVEGTENGFADWLLPGSRIRKEAAVLNDPRVPLSEYTDNVRAMISSAVDSSTDWGYTDVWQAMDIMRYRENSDLAGPADVFAFFDNILPIAGLAKNVINIPARLAANGARTAASEITADLIAASQRGGLSAIDDILGTPALATTANRLRATTAVGSVPSGPVTRESMGNTMDNLVEAALPKIVNPLDAPAGVGVSGLIMRNLERGQELVRRVLGELPPSERMVGEEIEKAIEAAALRFGERLDRDVVLDVNARTASVNLTSGSRVYRIEAEIGKKDGTLFVDEVEARVYAASIGLSDEAIEVMPEPAGVSLRVLSDVSEHGAYVTGLTSRLPSGPFAYLRRWTSSARGILDENLMGAALLAGNRRNAVASALKVMAQPLTRLSGEEFEALQIVTHLGRDGFVHDGQGLIRSGQWFTDSQLDEVYRRGGSSRINGREVSFSGRAITPHERAAYHAARNINDMEYALRNDERYLELFGRGFEDITIDGAVGITNRNGHVRNTFNASEGLPVFSVSDNALISADQVTARMASGDYVIVALAEEAELAGKPVSRILVRQSDMSVGPLSRVQLAYNPGGHRMYSGSYFSKQARFGEGGYGRTPQTYIVGLAKADVDEWNAVMERARLALIAGADDIELDRILVGRGFPSGREFIEGVESGLYQREVKFRTVFDRELPEEYAQMKVGNYRQLQDEAASGVVDMHQSRGQMYYGRRGEALKDFNGDQAATLNIYDTIDQSVRNISEIAAFGDFKTQAMHRWVNTYKEATNWGELQHAPLRRQFSDMVMTTSSDEVRQAGEAQRDVINRILNWKNPADFRGDRMARGLAEWVGSHTTAGTKGRQLARWISTEGVKATPISWLRTMAFDMKLGLLNVAQFPLQISTILAATSIDPVRGMQGMTALPFVRKFFATSFDEIETALEGMISNNIHKAIGFDDVAEFRAYMLNARQSGFLDVSAQATSDLGRQAAVKGDAIGGGIVGKVQDFGRIPFVEAEVWNRIVGRHIAWQRLRKQMPDLDYNSSAFHNRLSTIQDDFTGNMQRESQAAWQNGIVGLPTQFFSYQARMLELMLSKRLTHSERARLILGQGFFYGSGGIPLASIASDVMTDHEDGEVGKLNTWRGFFDRGALDHIVWNLMEADVQIGDRLAVGDFIEDQVRNIMNLSAYGETSFFDVVTGATGGITLETSSDLVALMWAAAVEVQAGNGEGMPVTRRSMTNFVSNISSLSNAIKAYTAFSYGTYVSNSGTVLVEDLTPVEAVFAALSYQPGSVATMSAQLAWSGNRSDTVRELAQHRSRLWSRYLTEPNNRADILTEMDHFMQFSVPEQLRSDVIRQARMSSSIARSVQLSQPLQARLDRAQQEGNQ